MALSTLYRFTRRTLALTLGFIIYIIVVICQDHDDQYEDYLFIKTFDDDSVIKIAFWNSFFGKKRWGLADGERRKRLSCDEPNINCILYSSTTNQPLLYDALVFHGRDPHRRPPKRSPKQVYIMLLMESPAYRGNDFIKERDFYNWTMTYSRKSDFQIRYLAFRQKKKPKAAAPMFVANQTLDVPSESVLANSVKIRNHKRTNGEAFVLWIASHCSTHSRREEYVNELTIHISVDVYGKCGQDCSDLELQSRLNCHEALAKTGRYKFYLALENSACRDYITEKPLFAFRHGLVPIVYGGLSTEDYTSAFPPNSFIDVRNFSTPKKLADYLLFLDENEQVYMEYHRWRQEWELGSSTPDTWCQVCKRLHSVRTTHQLTSLSRTVDWRTFWDPETECDSQMLENRLGRD